VSAGAILVPPALPEPIGDGGTLDELVAALWEVLSGNRVVACPVCGAAMKPEYGVHARPIGGTCSTCGASLH
jgi:hypothetical protein